MNLINLYYYGEVGIHIVQVFRQGIWDRGHPRCRCLDECCKEYQCCIMVFNRESDARLTEVVACRLLYTLPRAALDYMLIDWSDRHNNREATHCAAT